MRLYRTPDGAEYPEHETIARYQSPFVVWICLNTTRPGDERRSCKFYALCNLTDVTPGVDCSWMRGMRQFAMLQFTSGLYYTCAEKPPAPLVIEMTADMIGSFVTGKPGVDPKLSHGVDIRVVEKPVTAIVLWQPVTEWRLSA